MIDRRTLTLIVLLSTCIGATAGAQDDQHSRTVIGPSNIDLADGAEALLAGDAEQGVRLTERGLKAAANNRERVAGYSTGMRTRLALARSLLHDPELLILDEPTAGLDPESAVAVRELILATARTGKTVLMSTHLLHEAEGTADQLIMMDHGRAWERGTPTDLAARYMDGLVVRFDANDRASLEPLAEMAGARVLDRNGGIVARIDPPDGLPAIVSELVAKGAQLTRVEPQTPTLERLYFEMRRRATADQ